MGEDLGAGVDEAVPLILSFFFLRSEFFPLFFSPFRVGVFSLSLQKILQKNRIRLSPRRYPRDRKEGVGGATSRRSRRPVPSGAPSAPAAAVRPSLPLSSSSRSPLPPLPPPPAGCNARSRGQTSRRRTPPPRTEAAGPGPPAGPLAQRARRGQSTDRPRPRPRCEESSPFPLLRAR